MAIEALITARRIVALGRRLPVRAAALLFAAALPFALGAAVLMHGQVTRAAYAGLEGEGLAVYRGLAAAASPAAATQEFEAAAQQALAGTRIVGLGVYHAGLAPLARAGSVPEALSPGNAAVPSGELIRRHAVETYEIVFAAPQDAGTPLLVLLRMDARATAAALVAEAWQIYGGAILLAALGALAGSAALWRAYVEPTECLSRLAARSHSDAVASALLSRPDTIGTVARDLDDARRARAAIEIERAETEERIESTLRQRARQLFAAKERAEAANLAKSSFLANMSHELRTPLNAVIGFSSIMKEQMLGPIGVPRYVEYVADINLSATHLLGIVNDILDMSKIESEAVDLREETFDVAALVEECSVMLRDRIQAKNVAFAVNVAPVVPAIRADRRRIKQILINLLSNADKFTEAGGRIGLHVTTNADGGVEFNVSDSGIGMTEDETAIALKPFGQVDSRLARKYDGAGLGLPLTKAMVEMHQGQLVIDSKPGRGTTAIVILPAERAVAVEAAAYA